MALGGLLGACATEPDLEAPYDPPPPTPASAAYQLGMGDQLVFEYCRRQYPVDEYCLGIGDLLDIQVEEHPELNEQTRIAPDGTISFHRLGQIQAVDRKIEDLQSEMESRLAEFYPNLRDSVPKVVVFLIEGDQEAEKFVEMLLRNPNGASREFAISPDGHVSLPGIGAVRISGLSLVEAEDLLNERLQRHLPTLELVLNSQKLAQNVFSVLGEVLRPGVYDLTSETTLVEALAKAGGETEYAALDSVVVMSRMPDGVIEASLYDLEEAFEHGHSLGLVQIRPRDTVLILRTGIGNVNEAIDHFIRRNLPINVGVGYNAVYRLND
ncbi:MAG: hypothetical protein DWQ01_18455 [Planctomycetota bacterium]|nr:MAG: hypothetical protein DWQ01_18455 [Planctomycetota bacterium]